MTGTFVHLVRHGEVYNPQGVLYGRLPGYHLSGRGIQMAEKLGDWFADRQLDYLAASPLQRAQETMRPIAAAHPDLAVEIDERLIEADNRLAGQRLGKRKLGVLKPQNLRWYLNPSKPSWGEPYTDIAARMQAAVLAAAERAGAGGETVLVSHQLPIWICRLAVEGKRLPHNPMARQCRLASVTSVCVTAGQIEFSSYTEPAAELRDADSGSPFSSGR